MLRFNRFVDYSEEDLIAVLTLEALDEDIRAYNCGDYDERDDRLRRVELLQEAAERIKYLKDGWADCLTDGEI